MSGAGSSKEKPGGRSLLQLGFSSRSTGKRSSGPIVPAAAVNKSAKTVRDLEPLSEYEVEQFTTEAPYAQYVGIKSNAKGQEVHSWRCSICKDGKEHRWAFPCDALRHAKDSKTHQAKVMAVSSAKGMAQIRQKARQEQEACLLDNMGKVLCIAAHMMVMNESWRKFPDVRTTLNVKYAEANRLLRDSIACSSRDLIGRWLYEV